MSTLRIKDAPLLPDVDGSEKIPTGGRGDYAVSVDQLKTFAQGSLPQQLEDHINDVENPHNVTKDQVGLGNVDNTSDLDKPISTATQTELNLKANEEDVVNALNLKADLEYVNDALNLKANTEDVDAALNLKADKTYVDSQDNLKLDKSEKANANGLATLDSSGKVPAEQLPSYVDDVLEFTSSTLPSTGESGKIYITTDTNRTWRWSGTQYVEISNGGISDSTLKLQTPRNIAGVSFDGTVNIDIPHNNLEGRNVSNAHIASAILDSDGNNQQVINDRAKALHMVLGADESGNLTPESAREALSVASLDENKKVPVVELPSATSSAAGVMKLINDLTTGGTDAALTAEQAKLFFAMFTGGTDYFRIPNPANPSRPKIVQFGKGFLPVTPTVVIHEISFPITFPNGVSSVVLSHSGAAANGFYPRFSVESDGMTGSKFRTAVVTSNSQSGTSSYFYVAIGD